VTQTSTSLKETKHQVAIANRMLSLFGLATWASAPLGHASARLPGDPSQFIVKGRGYDVDALAAMTADDLVTCDLDGYKTAGPEGIAACFEVKLHSCIYKARPDVQSIVHVHPRFTVLMSILAGTLVPMCVEGLLLVKEPLPIYEHSRMILTDEEGTDVADKLGQSPAILLRGHGAITAGKSLPDSVTSMLLLEEQAKMNYYARSSDGPNHARMPDEDIAEWISGLETGAELPHHKEAMREMIARGRGAESAIERGIWGYYSRIIEKEMREESHG
jgi:ribulose-5-phosphate 4-epimerase/fuculose-1-phosphate aldolase